MKMHPPARHSPNAHPAPRAFCTLLIIASMIFIVMAVVAMTSLFAHEAHRTHAALAQTQLRQLLLAAVPAAQAEIQSGPAPRPVRDVTLPVPVEGATLTLHIDGDTVLVQATYRGAKASQKSRGSWPRKPP